MYTLESALEIATHKLIWDFDVQTDHLISPRRQDFIIISKKRELAELSTLLSWLNALKESEKKDKYLNLAVEHESDSYTNCNWCSWYSHQRISKVTGSLGNKRTRRDQTNY